MVTFVLSIIVAVVIVFSVIGVVISAEFGNIFLGLIPLILGLTLSGIIIISLTLIFEIGTIGLIINALNGNPYDFNVFKETLSKYYLRAFGTTMGFTIIYSIAFLILLIPILAYMLTIGLLSGGWALLLLSGYAYALTGYWALIMIDSHKGGFESIGQNIRFGAKNWKIMFLIFFLPYYAYQQSTWLFWFRRFSCFISDFCCNRYCV